MPRMGVYDQIKTAFQDLVAPAIRELRGDIRLLDQKTTGSTSWIRRSTAWTSVSPSGSTRSAPR